MASTDTTTIITMEEIKVPKEVVRLGDWIDRDRKNLRRKIKKTERKRDKLNQRLAEMPDIKKKLVPFTTVVDIQQQTVVAQAPSN